MALEIEKLLVSLEATTKQYETGLAKASGTTVTAMRRIETTLQASAARQQAIFSRMAAGLKTALIGFGSGFLGALSLGALANSFTRLFNEIANLGEAADKAGTSIRNLQRLTAAGINTGFGQEKIVQLLGRFNMQLAEAAIKGSELGKILEANNVPIKDANGNYRDSVDLLKDIADLIKNAASDQERMLIAGAAFGDRFGRQAVPFLKAGGDELERLMQNAEAAGQVIDDEIVRKADAFVDNWAIAVDIWKKTLFAGIFDVGTAYDTLTAKARDFLASIGISGPNLFEFIKLQQGPSVVGTRGDRLDRAAPKTVLPPRAPGKGETETLNEYERANEAIKRRIALLGIEAQVFGQSTAAAEKARVVFELLTAAREAGLTTAERLIDVEPKLREQIEQLATAYGDAAAKITMLEEAQKAAAESAEELARVQEESIRRMEELRDAGTDSMKGFVKDLIDGKSAADALNNAMQRLGDRFIDMGLDSIFTPVFGTAGTIIIEGTQT